MSHRPSLQGIPGGRSGALSGPLRAGVCYVRARLEQNKLPGSRGAARRESPTRRRAAALHHNGEHFDAFPTSAAAADRLRAHQGRGEERPSDRRMADRGVAERAGRLARRGVEGGAAWRAARRGVERGGSAAPPRRRGSLPAQRLDGAAQPLQGQAGGRVLLAEPLALGVLRGLEADLQARWPRPELRAGEAAARRSCARSRT